MIVVREGDIFENNHAAYAHGVSTLGTMGKGIAVQFKGRYPLMFQEYRRLCSNSQLSPGDSFYFFEKGDHIYSLVTQQNLFRAENDFLIESVKKMFVHAKEQDITDIAMPQIGCGLGKLSLDGLTVALAPFVGSSHHHVTVYELSSPVTD